MSQFKRFLGWVVILSLALALFPLSVAGANNVTVSIDAPDEPVDSGSGFIATVSITEVTDLDSFQFEVSYDPSILEVNNVTDGLIGSTAVPVLWNVVAPSQRLRVVGNLPGVTGVTGSGYLAEIHFNVTGSPGTTSDLTLSNGHLWDNMAAEIPVTEWRGDSVHVSGEATGPIISFRPSSLSFSAVEGGDGPPDQTLEIWNSGVDTLSWEVSASVDWLGLSPTTGSSTGEEDAVTVSVDVSGMTAGAYDASITISSPEGTRTAAVELNVGVPGGPPTFTVSHLHISPTEVESGDSVDITAEVSNTGGTEGSHDVVLKINGEVQETKSVTLAPGASETVAFTVTRDVAGTYDVDVDGESGQFTVREAGPAPSGPNWPLFAGIIVAVAVIAGLLVYFLVLRKRA